MKFFVLLLLFLLHGCDLLNSDEENTVTEESELSEVVGNCGSAHGVIFGANQSTFGTLDLCSSGILEGGSFPASGERVNWSCMGRGGGETALCSASRETTELANRERTMNYTYDDLGRLSKIENTLSGQLQCYFYDKAGNIISISSDC